MLNVESLSNCTPRKRPSLLKNSTNELLRMRTTLFCSQITAKRYHIDNFSDAFLLSEALQ